MKIPDSQYYTYVATSEITLCSIFSAFNIILSNVSCFLFIILNLTLIPDMTLD